MGYSKLAVKIQNQVEVPWQGRRLTTRSGICITYKMGILIKQTPHNSMNMESRRNATTLFSCYAAKGETKGKANPLPPLPRWRFLFNFFLSSYSSGFLHIHICQSSTTLSPTKPGCTAWCIKLVKFSLGRFRYIRYCKNAHPHAPWARHKRIHL